MKKTDWYSNLLPPEDRRERELWRQATLRVYRGAHRRKDKRLAEFAAMWAYGCDLVKLT